MAHEALTNRDGRWWAPENKDRQHDIIQEIVNQTLKAQAWRRDAYTQFAQLYNRMTAHGFGANADLPRPPGDRLAINIIKNCSDAFVAQLCEEQPRVTFLTSGGDADLQDKAEDLEAFVDGQFYATKIHEEEPRVILDACITGTGFLHIYIEGEGKSARVAIERIHPREIIVDDLDGLGGKPRSLYQRKLIDKLVLKAIFPDAAEDIENLSVNREDESWPALYETTAELVPVTLAWHLRSSPNDEKDEEGNVIAHDGVHTICVQNKTLYSGPWKYDYFPFAIYRRQWAQDGFWGIGLADELYGIQREINVLAQKIQDYHYYASVGHWLVERNSKVTAGHLDNNPKISIVNFTGTPPQLYFPPPMSGDVYGERDRLKAMAYELTGISELHAEGKKPAGVDSGKGMATFANIVSKRFSVAVHNRHAMWLDCAKQIVDRSREIVAEDNPQYSVTSVSKYAMNEVEFLKVDLSEAEAVLQMHPTNKMAKEPSELLGQIRELRDLAPTKFDEDAALELFGMPDVKSTMNRIQASEKLTRRIVMNILKNGEVIPPEPFMDLGRWEGGQFVPGSTIKIAQMEILNAQLVKRPEENIRKLRAWIVFAKKMVPGGPPEEGVVEPMPPDGGPPPGGPSGPGGEPMPPPEMMPPMGAPMPGGPMPPMPPVPGVPEAAE